MTTNSVDKPERPVPLRPVNQSIKFNPSILRLAPLLANRDYQSRELAIELRLSNRDGAQVRAWCRSGLPHTHDEVGRLLINGHAFAAWVRQYTGPIKRQKLLAGHMWCPGCNLPQPFEEATTSIDISGRRPKRIAICPQGHRMSQWVSVR